MTQIKIMKNRVNPVKCLLVLIFPLLVFAQSSFQIETQKWREKREASLKAEGGWLTVSGLFWLKQGPNSFGAGSKQNIVLPANSAPENIGTLELTGGVVTLKVADGVVVTVNEKPVREFEMRFDNDNQPEPFAVGSLKLSVIKRGERYGLRVRDKNSRARREFKGLTWFPAQESYRVVASFIPDEKPKEIVIMNVLGDELKMKSPGTLSFVLHGKSYQL